MLPTNCQPTNQLQWNGNIISLIVIAMALINQVIRIVVSVFIQNSCCGIFIVININFALLKCLLHPLIMALGRFELTYGDCDIYSFWWNSPDTYIMPLWPAPHSTSKWYIGIRYFCLDLPLRQFSRKIYVTHLELLLKALRYKEQNPDECHFGGMRFPWITSSRFAGANVSLIFDQNIRVCLLNGSQMQYKFENFSSKPTDIS